MAIVYRIVAPSGSAYVGMTMGTLEQRWKAHRRLLAKGSHHCSGLQKSAEKYGIENLFPEVLETFPAGAKESFVLLREKAWWNYFHAVGVKLYNSEPSGFGSVLHREETKLRISETLRSNALSKKFDFTPHAELIKEWSSDPKRSQEELCGKLGITRGQLRGYLRKEGIIFTPKQRLNLDDYPICFWYFEEGLSTWRIAEKIGCSQPVILPVIQRDLRYIPGNERKKFNTLAGVAQ